MRQRRDIFPSLDQITNQERRSLNRHFDNYQRLPERPPFIFYIIEQDILQYGINLTYQALKAGVAFYGVRHGRHTPLSYSNNHQGRNDRTKVFIRECAELVELVEKNHKTNRDKNRMEELLANREAASPIFPDIRDVNGKTLLHLAIENDDLTSFSVLMNAQADINLIDLQGRSAWNYTHLSRQRSPDNHHAMKRVLAIKYQNMDHLILQRKENAFFSIVKKNIWPAFFIIVAISGNYFLSVSQAELDEDTNQWLSLGFTTLPTLAATYVSYKQLEEEVNQLNLVEEASGLSRVLQTELPCKISTVSVTATQMIFFLGYVFLALFLPNENDSDHETTVKNVLVNSVSAIITAIPLILRSSLSSKLAGIKERVLSPTCFSTINGNGYVFSVDTNDDSLFSALALSDKKVCAYLLQTPADMDEVVRIGLTIAPDRLLVGEENREIIDRMERMNQLATENALDPIPDGMMRALIRERPHFLSVIFEHVLPDAQNNAPLMRILGRLKGKPISLWTSAGNLRLEQCYHQEFDAIYLMRIDNRYLTLSSPLQEALPEDHPVLTDHPNLWDQMSHHERRLNQENMSKLKCCC